MSGYSSSIILGEYTFQWPPTSTFEIIQPRKPISVIETYSGIAYFKWQLGEKNALAGQRIVLEWEFMPAEQYRNLLRMYCQDDVYSFYPNGDDWETGYDEFYEGDCWPEVSIVGLTGTYFLDVADNNTYRKNVKLELLVRSIDFPSDLV